MSSPARVVETVHLATLATLTGLVALDPLAGMRRAPDYAGWLTGQQRLDRVLSRVAPPLFLSTAAAAAGATLVALGQRRTGLAVARALATCCTAAAIGVTLVVNEPANAQLRRWRPADAPPDGWRTVRARWDQGHRYRRGLVSAAAVAAAWGQLVAVREGRRG